MKAIGFVVFTAIAASMAAPGVESGQLEGTSMQRPWMFVTREKMEGLRSLAEVRSGIEQGHGAELWEQLLAKVGGEMQEEPISAKGRNRSFEVVAETANRLTDAALVALITGERRYADAALEQIFVLFDSEQWPEWADQAHINAGLKADLRHGQFARALGMAYDWLDGFLTDEERRRLLAGIDRCAIGPYKAGVEAEETWTRRRSNWMTCVVGGFGILGMGLGPDHPDADWLVEFARPRMEGYMEIFGPEGEFNESAQYSGSTMYVVDYFLAERYASGGKIDPLKEHGLGDFCRWYLYCTLPPGRVVGFGDPAADMPPAVAHLGAVASSLGDPTAQWLYRQYADLMSATHRRRCLELLFYDPSVETQSPEGRLPLGRAFHSQARIITSRSSWDPLSTPSVVYAKAAREDYHGHADWGQVCVDGYGERLIVDLGSPPGYPRDHKERHYNYQQSGHNVLVLEENETGGIPVGERRAGGITHAEFDDARGGAWTMDLSAVYGEGRRVVRHVIHLLPRVAVVLDEAELAETGPISLRWHTIAPVEPDDEGCFTVRGEQAALAGRVLRLDGGAEVAVGRHEYREPYNKHRLGEPYSQRHEPFVEVTTQDDRCRILSLFCVFGPDEPVRSWTSTANGWAIETEEGAVHVTVEQDRLAVENVADGRGWEVEIGGMG